MSINKMTLRLTNSNNTGLKVHLEPWGEECEMESGATIEIAAQGPSGDTLEVEYGENVITVYGWSGSTISVSEVCATKDLCSQF